MEELDFTDIALFNSWKEEEEFRTNSQYVRKSAPYTDDTTRIYYYYCNRAGKYTSRGKQERQLKVQGTSKIGEQCSAHLKASVNVKSGHVTVLYCKTHQNHHTKLAHLRMRENKRQEVASKLQSGVDMDRILDDIRETVNIDGVNRDHLINRQDLHNIKQQYNINGVRKHNNDLESERMG